MKKEEKILIDKFGKANHFSVPEGYFESFTDQMMDLLPESEVRVIEMRPATWWNRLPIKKVAAAVGAVLVIGAGSLWMSNHTHSDKGNTAVTSSMHHTTSGSEYGTFDQMADYTMMDNQTIYASLVGENL